MIKYIIAADLTALAFIIVLIIATYFTNKDSSRKTKSFKCCLLICSNGLLFNALSYILSGNISSNFIVGAVNYLAFIFVDVLIMTYAVYYYYLIKEKYDKFPKIFVIYIAILCSIDFIFLTVGTIIGKLFTVENGVYKGGILWNYSPIIPAICMVTFLIALLVHYKKIGLVYGVALASYALLTLLCSILQLTNVNIELSFVGSAVSLLIIYIMIQSGRLNESKLRAEVFNELSTLDVLTGLKNRRGFENEIVKIKECNNVTGIFCDLNSLKLVNDTMGHEAGDKYIKKFAEILRNEFPNDFLSRVSGDEFIIVIRNITKEELDKKMDDFSNILITNNDIAVFGYSTGNGKDIINIIKEAERLMYQEKEKHYQRVGKTRRYY